MRMFPALLPLLAVFFLASAPAREVAELNFGSGLDRPEALAEAQTPAWITRIEQSGGSFLDSPACWRVPGPQPEGVGRLTITLDRARIAQDLVATVLFDADAEGDLAVQLFDAQGRVVVLDLYGNLVDVGREARTDTVIIPLHKYPTAAKIVLRRIKGEISVYGVVLFPVVGEGEPDNEALKKLASVLGDPLSPENPLFKSLQKIALRGNVTIAPPTSASPAPPIVKARGPYAPARPPAAGTKIAPPPTDGLIGWWNFNAAAGEDSSPRQHHGTVRGGAQTVPGARGKALQLRLNSSQERAASWDSVTFPVTPAFALTETLTVAAWVKYSSIMDTWGSQIVWFGNSDFGCDPWQLHLWTDGTLEFRSDRSVTGQPTFIVHEDEIQITPGGRPILTQHVGLASPDKLAPETWYFVAATLAKTSARARTMTLFVNGESVGELKTEETVNYSTEKMWLTIGGVDLGTWQNFAGLIDDVRIYRRALSAAEIRTLYQQPWE